MGWPDNRRVLCGGNLFGIRFKLFREQWVIGFSLPTRRYSILLVAVLGLTLASCDGNPALDDPLADSSFLTQQPCAAPCWYGLEPDKSTADDVIAALRKLPFVDSGTIWESTVICA
jgi:hypothetical protein